MSSAPTPARKRLPIRPSSEHLRKQAKRLARKDAVPLAEGQHRLALDYGTRSWAELMHVVETMRRGEDRLEYTEYDFEALPTAANEGNIERVREILATGRFSQHDLDLALARSVLRFRERESIARLLVEHGADPDGQYGADYGPIVFVTGECLDVDGLEFLIDNDCDVTGQPIGTKFGRQCPLSTWLGSYLRGRSAAKRQGIDLLLEHGAHVPSGVTPVVLAVHRDDADALRIELERDPELARRTFESFPYCQLVGATLLHYAAELGASACIKTLVEHGAAVNARTKDGLTPLACAARGAGPHDLRLLLASGGHSWVSDAAGLAPADHARASSSNPHSHENARLLSEVIFDDDRMERAVGLIDRGEVEQLRALLVEHPDLVTARVKADSAITHGYFRRPTLLHFVACNPNRSPRVPPRIEESARMILEAGAEVDAVTDSEQGSTTLALIASSGPAHDDGVAKPLIELLVAFGAEPEHGLRAAILHRFIETTRLLHSLGASPTALSAAGLGDLIALRALVATGLSDEDLRCAGWAAAMNGEAGAIDLLVDAGLDVNARLPRPFAPTMMHEAAWHGERAACECLLRHGADATIRDTQYDATPAGWAREAGWEALADWIESA